MPGSLGNLGGVSYDIIAEDKTQSGVNSSVAGLARVTAAMAAVAAASTLMSNATDSYDRLSQTSVLTSAKLGTSVEAVNDAVRRAAAENTDFVTDTSKGFDLLARSGESSLSQIASDYHVFSDMGKVAGESSVAVESEVIPALKAFGLEVSDAAQYEDVFTSVTRDTTLSLGEFTGFISRSALNLQSLGLTIEDTAAIFEILADKGIQGRQAMRVFSNAMQEQEAQTKSAQKASEDYAEAQKELTNIQDKSNLSLVEYGIRMQAAGRNVKEARRLTMERRIEQIRENAETDKANEKAATAQAAMSSASKSFDVYAALGVTSEEVSARKELIASNKGLTEKLAAGIDTYQTASDKAAQQIEQAGLTAGQLLDPIKDVTVAVRDLSTVMAVIGAGTSIAQAAGALKSGGGLAGGAGGFAGGLKSGGALSKGAGSAGGIAEGLGVGSAGAMAQQLPVDAAEEVAAGGEAFAPMAAGEAGNFAATAESGAVAGGSAAAGTSLAAAAAPLAGLGIGALAVYGLEQAGLLGLTGKGAVRSAGDAAGGALYRAGYDTADAAKVISIGAVQLSKDYDFQKFVRDMNTYMGMKRLQRGYRQ